MTDAPRVLVVDDVLDAADSLALLLLQWGYTCDVAYHGVVALRALEKREYDVIIADLLMPRMDGFELARNIRSSAGRQPVLIAMTGLTSAQDRERAAECGYDHYLLKPVDPKVVRDLLKTLAK